MTKVTNYQKYMNHEYDRLTSCIDCFRSLLPHPKHNASLHSGEEGRYIESLFEEFLRKKLPSKCEIGTGFIVNTNTKTTSYQTDIIVYDRLNYSPISNYGTAVVVPHKSVIAAISVKKNISYDDIEKETKSLSAIGTLCGGTPKKSRIPYLAILACSHGHAPKNFVSKVETSFKRIINAYPPQKTKWSGNEIINDLIVLDDFVIHRNNFKTKQSPSKKASFQWAGADGHHRHYFLQHILNGIREVIDFGNSEKGSITIELPKIGMKKLGSIDVCAVNRPPR